MCRISKGVMVSSSGCLNAKPAAPLVGGGRFSWVTVLMVCRLYRLGRPNGLSRVNYICRSCWRQSVLPVHLLGLDALLGSVGPVAGDVKLQDDGVVHDPVNRRGGGHGVGKDALPL